MNAFATLLALTLTADVINGADTLEPSVLNEIDHALARAPVFVPGEPLTTTNVFQTNGLSATALAVRLVSLQRADGRWFVGTTNATAEAVAILTRLSETGDN